MYTNLDKELWDLFTRKEEYLPHALDKHDRFNPPLSYNKKIIYPSVSIALKDDFDHIEYPSGKKFAVCLTHDVDDIYPPFSHMMLSSLISIFDINIPQLWNQYSWRIKGKSFSPYKNFKEIMDIEEHYGAKSSFYFMATNEDIRRFRYNIEELENELALVEDRGFEIGLHGGYFAYNNLKKIVSEKERIEKILNRRIIGYRNHYLRFEIPLTWNLLYRAGFKYDTTLGYSSMIGFRNGMCHPYKPFDLTCNGFIDIFEMPLVIMDSALFNLNKSAADAWLTAKSLIDIVDKNNGLITILWHNYIFSCPFRRDWAKLYLKILDYCYRKGAWMTSCEESYNFWKIHFKYS